MNKITTDDGVGLHVEIAGKADGPALLLSNSLGTRLEMWDSQMAALTPHYRVIRYDSRGHGRSDAPKGDYTIERLGRDALAVLDSAGVAKTHFCGVSKGGMVGQWLGTYAADRVNRLVLANTAAIMGPPESWQSRIELVLKDGMAALTDAVIERWFTAAFRAARPDAIAPVRDMLLRTSPVGYAGCCAAIRDMDQRASIRAIAVPTLVIGGAFDPATPPEKAQEIARAIPGAKLLMLEAAHLSNIEQAEAFTAALLNFLETR